MSTIKSSAENLTLNADGANNDIKFQSNGSEVASIDQAGLLTATSFAGSGAALTGVGVDGIVSNANATAMTIDSAENIGIGTASPATLLHLEANVAKLRVEETSGSYVELEAGGSTGYVSTKASHPLVFKPGGTERARVETSGGLLVGRTTSAWDSTTGLALNQGNSGENYVINNGVCMYFNRAGTEGKTIRFYKQAGTEVGSITTYGASTLYTTSSDYRLKENVDYDWDATTRLKQLKPARFNFISDNTNTLVDGFIAHEVSSVVPEAITGTKDAMEDEEYEVTPAVMDGDTVVTEAVMGTRSVPDMQGIDQSKLVPLLVKTIQELEARITALEA